MNKTRFKFFVFIFVSMFRFGDRFGFMFCVFNIFFFVVVNIGFGVFELFLCDVMYMTFSTASFRSVASATFVMIFVYCVLLIGVCMVL